MCIIHKQYSFKILQAKISIVPITTHSIYFLFHIGAVRPFKKHNIEMHPGLQPVIISACRAYGVSVCVLLRSPKLCSRLSGHRVCVIITRIVSVRASRGLLRWLSRRTYMKKKGSCEPRKRRAHPAAAAVHNAMLEITTREHTVPRIMARRRRRDVRLDSSHNNHNPFLLLLVSLGHMHIYKNTYICALPDWLLWIAALSGRACNYQSHLLCAPRFLFDYLTHTMSRSRRRLPLELALSLSALLVIGTLMIRVAHFYLAANSVRGGLS